MKKMTLVLAMLLVAATTFTQTSRRTANDTNPARDQENRRTVTTGKTDHPSGERKSTQTTTNTRRSAEVNKNDSQKSTDGRENTQRENVQRNTQERTNSNGRRVNPSGENENREQYRRENDHQTGDNDRNRGSYETRRYTNTVRVSANRERYESPRNFREQHTVVHRYSNPPRSVHYRARHYPYRRPVHVDIIWTPAMRTEYFEIYPMVRTWRYPVGYRIQTISAYDAYAFAGDVMNVYGKVEEVFYAARTDEYIMYFGAYYPYYDFSVVVPGPIARMYSRRPEMYFEQQFISVTGLITVYDDRPEIVVRRANQINPY